jgi:nucleoid-associated protein YgaU
MKKDDKDREKSRPDFSNVESGSSSTAPPPRSIGPAPSSGGQTRTYVVQKGDSLSRIAKKEYGNANDWRKIFEANRDVIEDPDLIYPGQTLQIPAP